MPGYVKTTPLTLPMPGSILVGSLAQAKWHKRKFDAVITIQDPLCRPNMRLRFSPDPGRAQLVLKFEDVDTDSIGIRVATIADVREAIDFARCCVGRPLLVHCFHGVGRSAGVALAILADRLGSGEDAPAIEQLLAIRPEATPNLVVVQHADRILERSGKLIAAVAAWEASAPGLKEVRAARLNFACTHPELYARVKEGRNNPGMRDR
jgi:predicted protein tyrosine phosphatase